MMGTMYSSKDIAESPDKSDVHIPKRDETKTKLSYECHEYNSGMDPDGVRLNHGV